MSVIFEFGPGETFVFDTPGGTTTNKVPDGLKDLELGVGQGRPIDAIYSLNFGDNGTYVLAARTEKGALIRRNNLPSQLESWLIDPITQTCKRDIATLSVEFGPNNSFYARDKDSYRWHNLPDALEEAIQQRLSPSGWMARPDFVVLGADGAFIYSNDRGGCSHALGNYPKLQQYVIELQRANIGGLSGFALVQWISMSLHTPGHFVALRNSGQYVAEVPPDAAHALNSLAGTFPVRNFTPQQPQQRAVSQPITHQSSFPPAYQTSPPPMTHSALPIRKPVGSAPSYPQNLSRPPAPHLVSSPIPQTQQHRPTPQTQNSAPVIPQMQNAPRPTVLQSPTQSSARPISMQVPPQNAHPSARNRTSMNLKAFGKIANQFSHSSHQQHNNINQNAYSYNYNSSSNSNNTSNANTDININTGGPTYVVTDGGSSAPNYAPTSTSNESNSTLINDTNVYNTTVDNTTVYNTNVADTNVYSTNVAATNIYNTNVDSTSTYNTNIDNTTVYNTNVADTNVYNTNVDSTNTYNTNQDNTTMYYTALTDNNATYTSDNNSYDVADTSGASTLSAADTLVSPDSISGDATAAAASGGGGGFWSGLLASGSGGDVSGGSWAGDCSQLI